MAEAVKAELEEAKASLVTWRDKARPRTRAQVTCRLDQGFRPCAAGLTAAGDSGGVLWPQGTGTGCRVRACTRGRYTLSPATSRVAPHAGQSRGRLAGACMSGPCRLPSSWIWVVGCLESGGGKRLPAAAAGDSATVKRLVMELVVSHKE